MINDPLLVGILTLDDGAELLAEESGQIGRLLARRRTAGA